MKLPALFPKARPATKRPRRPARVPAPQAPPRPATPLPPIALPADLKQRLVALRHRYRTVFAGTGISMLLGAASLLFLIQGLSDWWLDLPWATRAGFLLIDIVLFGFIWRRHLHLPLQKKLGLTETALLVEKKWPQLRQNVITAVELTEGKPNVTRGSPQLVELLLQQARMRTASLDFRDVVPTDSLRRWVLAGGVATLGTLVVAVTAWPASLVLLERLFLLNVPLPTKTVVVSVTRDMTVPIGSDVTVTAQAQGVIPAHGRVTVSYNDAPPEDIPLNVQPDKPGLFSFTVRNAQQPFKYCFYLNDGHGPEFTVMAKVPPALNAVECMEIFPDYTGLPPQKLPSTGLSLLAGSHLKIKASSTDALQKATVVLHGVSQQIEMSPGSSKKRLEADVPIPIKSLTGFSIHLVDTAGLSSANDTVYPITIVPDQPPVVKITEPVEAGETVTVRARPEIVFEASDDYGLTQLSFNYQLIPPAVNGVEGTPSAVQKLPIPIKTAKDETHYAYAVDIAAQSPAWQEGWTVNYWLEAVDNNTATGPGITKTAHKQFEILSPEAKEAEIQARIKQNAAEIDHLSNTQQKVSRDVGKAIPSK